jgi:hypothetical protein
MPIIKNLDLNLDAFLHSITCFLNIEINKQFNIIDDIDDISINLNNLLNYNPIRIYYQPCVFSYINEIILDITFKFMAGYNMQLIYDYFYMLRKK